jgi:hypothetical protein
MTLAEQKFEHEQTRGAARAFRFAKNAVSSPQKPKTGIANTPFEDSTGRVEVVQDNSQTPGMPEALPEPANRNRLAVA